MRVIVAGSRGITSATLVYSHLDRILGDRPEITVISGTARGVDQLGEQWGMDRGHDVERYPADWDRYGKSAGYRRNEVMAKNADALIAFWDRDSRGTKHMIDLAETYGLIVFVIDHNGMPVVWPKESQ